MSKPRIGLLVMLLMMTLSACTGDQSQSPSDLQGSESEAPVEAAADVDAPEDEAADEDAAGEEADAASDEAAEGEDAPESESSDAAEAPAFETVEVAEGLYSFGNGEAFAAFMVTDDGVIVMDSINSEVMLGAIREVTDQPIATLIYSHNHWDHISGGQVFKDEGATVLAHADISDWLVNHPRPNPAVINPDETWEGNRHDVELGGKTIELHHFGPSHGEGMTVFRFPDESTIFTVDLVVPERIGFAYMPDFSPSGWIETLKAMEGLEYETVMFSHMAASGPRSSVAIQREYLQDLQTEVMSRIQAGENPFQVVNTIELPKYQDWAGYDDWLTMNAWRIMLEMWMGH